MPSDAKVLWHGESLMGSMFSLGGRIFFSQSGGPLLPDGVRADVYTTTVGEPSALVSLDEIVAEFAIRDVVISDPQEGWITGWWSTGIHYRVYRVKNQEGYFTLINAVSPGTMEWPKDIGEPPPMPLAVPAGSRALVEWKDCAWDGSVESIWIYVCEKRPPLVPEGSHVSVESAASEDIVHLLLMFGNFDIWIKDPIQGWYASWKRERKPRKWEFYYSYLVESGTGYYLMVTWVYDDGVFMDVPSGR